MPIWTPLHMVAAAKQPRADDEELYDDYITVICSLTVMVPFLPSPPLPAHSPPRAFIATTNIVHYCHPSASIRPFASSNPTPSSSSNPNHASPCTTRVRWLRASGVATCHGSDPMCYTRKGQCNSHELHCHTNALQCNIDSECSYNDLGLCNFSFVYCYGDNGWCDNHDLR